MVPWSRQYRWFFVAAACLVGGIASLCTEEHDVIDHSVKVLPSQNLGIVYRRHDDLPAPVHSSSKVSEPKIEPLTLLTLDEPNAPLLVPHLPDDFTLVGPKLIPTHLQTDQTDTVVPVQLIKKHEPMLPEAIWLSGQIELEKVQ